MKSFTKSFVALSAVYFLAMGLAIAEPAEIYISDIECGVLNEDGFGVGPGHLVAISAHSANGNISVTCSLDLPRPSSGRSVIFNYDSTGLPCKVGGGSTTDDWHQVISASGKAKLSCHYKE